MALDPAGLLGTLFVQLAADNAQLIKGMAEAKETVQHGAEGIKGAIEGAKHTIEGFIAAFAVEKIAEFFHHMLESIDTLSKFSKETGVAIDNLGALQFAAQKANVGDEFAVGMRHFAASLREAQVEGTNAQAVFRSMNVTPFQALDRAFEEVSEQFSHWQDGVNKMGVAQELFGTRNARFVNLLNEGKHGLEEQFKLYRQLTGSEGLEQAAKDAERFNDVLTDFKALAMGVFLDLSKDLVPMFVDWATAIRDNHALIKDLGQILNAILVPTLKLVNVSLQLVTIGMGEMGKMAFDLGGIIVKALSPGLVILAKLGALATKTALGDEAFSGVAASFGKDWERIKEVLVKTQADLDQSLKRTLSDTGKALEEGGEIVNLAITKSVAPNVEALKAAQADLSKFLDSFAKQHATVTKETASLMGFGDTASIIGYREEIQVAQKHIADLRKIRDSRLELKKDELDKLNSMEKAYLDKQKALHQAEISLIMNTFTKMSNDILTIGEVFGGKQSALYETLFAASKAFAIAESTVKIMQGVAAAASQPWPLNLAAIASVIAATANIVSTIQSVKLEFGGKKALGGPVDTGRMFLVGERGPEMFVPNTTGNIIPNNQLMGGRTTINVINNHSDVQPEVTERQSGDERIFEILLRRVKKDVASDIKDGKGDVSRALDRSFGGLRRGQTQS